MKKLIISNIFYSLIEKFILIGFQFITSIIIIRTLPREDYGVIGVVAGYFVFLSFFNISMESIILRDHKNYEGKERQILSNFLIFNIFKSIMFLFFAIVLSVVLINMFQKTKFIYSIFSITILLIAESLVAPFVIYFTAKFNQKLVTKISTIKATLNLLLTTGLFMYPTLQYILVKDIFVSLFYISAWFYLVYKYLNFSLQISNINYKFIKDSVFGYSLWTHLNSVVTNFIYKSDTFFLSMFVGLVTIGNYNIALNSANIANILPMILGYQNSVALSHAKTKEEGFKISNAFIRVSVYIGIFTFLIFYFFGDFYLHIMTGNKNNQEIYSYMMYIVGGLIIVKSFANPLVSYINIKGSVISLFKYILIPIFIFTCIMYYFSAKYFGAIGVAKANIIVACMWLFLIIKEVKRYNYNFSSILDFKDDMRFILGVKKFILGVKNEK